MFPTYNSLAEVPEAFREHYKMSGGKAVAEVASDHPLVVNNATLVREKGEAETTKANAERERNDAKEALSKANVLQPGQRAVAKADADLLDAVKAAGVTKPEDFNALKTKHDEYKTTAEAATAAKHAESIGEAMGWDKEKTARLATKVYDFSSLELRDGADGKKTVVAKVKQADGTTVVEKSFADVVKTTAELSDLLPSLSAQGGGTRVPGSTGGAGNRPETNPADAYIASTYSAPKPRGAQA